MDLRTEFDLILKEWGQNIFLQRLRTPFIDTEHCTPKYTHVLEKHTVRSMNVLASRFLADTKLEQMEGIEYNSEMVFWFRHDVNPISGDRVYMDIPRYPSGQDPVYEIDYADPKYGVRGEIAFWATGATRIRPE